MGSLLETITRQLGGETMRQLSRRIGADESSTQAATGATLSTLLAALAKNSSAGEGAASLHRALAEDHDGSVLDDLAGFIGGSEAGAGSGILRHLLGAKQPAVEAGLARSSGLDTASAGRLMEILAPIVMGALGRKQQEDALDSQSLAGLLGGERQRIQREQPQAAGVLEKLLDSDHDGDVDLEDVVRQGAGLLGRFFKR
jgi:hypothetical protein